MIETILAALQFVEAMALAHTSFCRLIKTSGASTVPAIYHSFALLMTVALCVAFAPWWWGVPPHWIVLLLLSTILLIQAITAKYWLEGVPCQYTLVHDANQPETSHAS